MIGAREVSKLKNRIKSAIGSAKKPRAIDKIKELENRGVINQKQRNSWEFLRNRYAHGVRFRNNDDFFDHYSKYKEIIEMLYRIILYKIKFKGLYSSNLSSAIQLVPFELYKNI